MSARTRAYFGAYGFEPTTTGGGCTALQRQLPGIGLHVLATVAEDAAEPEQMGQPVTLGLYADNTGQQVAVIEAPTARAAIGAMLRGDWHAYDSNKPHGGQS